MLLQVVQEEDAVPSLAPPMLQPQDEIQGGSGSGGAGISKPADVEAEGGSGAKDVATAGQGSPPEHAADKPPAAKRDSASMDSGAGSERNKKAKKVQSSVPW